MQLSDLEKYGLPRRLIDLWRHRQGERLLPVQRQAVASGLLGRGIGHETSDDLIITAPTSSGKSFCAELAAARALAARQKVVMLFPLKALAEEKYRLLSSYYRPLGLRCLIVTGDHPENDSKFLEGDYHLAIAIYEKFDLLLATQLDALRSIGLVVVDELQMLTEPYRGAILERLLTKMLASTYRPTLLALSAVISQQAATQLGGWLHAGLVRETIRPVDLLRGVAADGALRLRSYNSGEDAQEPFTRFEQGEEAQLVFLRQVKEENGSTLVFMKSRRDTVDMAFKLAAMANWPAAESALEQLGGEEPSFLIRSLKQALGRGVAFHNSDLSAEQRQVVERAFINKEIKVLFTTTTLALGVNLPADTVYLETVKYVSGEYGSRPRLAPLSRAEFDNITGRAGRLGWQRSRPARAIVLAESSFDGDVLWDAYINSESAEPFESAFRTLPLEDWLLHIVVAGLADDTESAERVLRRSFHAFTHADARFDLTGALQALLESGLVARVSARDKFWATSVGQTVVKAGLTVAEAVHFLRKLDGEMPHSVFGWTALALSSPDWDLPPGVLSRMEYHGNLPVKTLYQRFDHSLDEVGLLLPENHRKEPLSYRVSASLKVALLLDDWCRLVALQVLEERYAMHLGQIVAVSETSAHLINGLASLIEAQDQHNPVVEMLRDHAFSLRHGLPAEMKELYEQFGYLLNRSDFQALRGAGLSSLVELTEAEDEQVKRLSIHKERAETFLEEIAMLREETRSKSMAPSAQAAMVGMPTVIEIDGAYEADRYLVRINGYPVRLTGKSFKYLTKLAWSRVSREAGWIYKEDLEIGFNQARYLYRLKSEIGLGYPSNWQVCENNRLGYYRLDIDPRGISINYENLKNFPDWEVQQLCSNPVAANHGNSLPC